jgi:adenylylsulfate kinase
LGFLTQIIDGDNVRSGINKNLSFTEEDRKENLRRIAEVNKLFLNCGVITINSFISPTDETREMAKDIIGEENFFEVYINSPLSVCEKRDTKGLYKKARSGELKNFTGIDSPFDAPKKPDLEIDTDKLSVDESVELLLNFIIPRIKKKRD